MTLNYACEQFVTPAEIEDDGCCDVTVAADGALLESVADMASDLLVILSGQRITGRCTATVTAVGGAGCVPQGFWTSLLEVPAGFQMGQNAIPLRGPNTTIDEVVIDGVVLDAGDYGLIDGTYLYRVGADWPSSGMTLTYSFGWPVDFVTKGAALELACELTSSFTGRTSRLPSGVTSANIQGAAVSVREAADSDGEGLVRVARFLNVYAPDGRGRSGVWSPELSQGWDLFEVT